MSTETLMDIQLIIWGEKKLNNRISRSTQEILELLSFHGKLDSSELTDLCTFSKRQCYYSLNALLKEGIVERKCCFNDTRKSVYQLTVQH